MRSVIPLLALLLVGGAAAQTIAVGQTVTGSLASRDARSPTGCLMDQFTLEIAEPQRIVIAAESETVDLSLEVLDPVGRCWRNEDASLDTVNPRVEIEIDTPGLCLVSLHAFHPRGQGDYRLSVAQIRSRTLPE